MILDSSAVVAMILGEPGSESLAEAMDEAPLVAIGASTLLETAIVLVNRIGLAGRALLSNFLEGGQIVVTQFDERHWLVANEAFLRYGKGRHPAGLNYGDCMSYATARVAGLPLLFVGNDFGLTDVTSALADSPR